MRFISAITRSTVRLGAAVILIVDAQKHGRVLCTLFYSGEGNLLVSPADFQAWKQVLSEAFAEHFWPVIIGMLFVSPLVFWFRGKLSDSTVLGLREQNKALTDHR